MCGGLVVMMSWAGGLVRELGLNRDTNYLSLLLFIKSPKERQTLHDGAKYLST
jgi:hypothetical protein